GHHQLGYQSSGPTQTYRVEGKLTRTFLFQFSTNYKRICLFDIAQKPRMLFQKNGIRVSANGHGAAISQYRPVVESCQDLAIRPRTCKPTLAKGKDDVIAVRAGTQRNGKP